MAGGAPVQLLPSFTAVAKLCKAVLAAVVCADRQGKICVCCLDCAVQVWQVRASYDAKPYRKTMMQCWWVLQHLSAGCGHKAASLAVCGRRQAVLRGQWSDLQVLTTVRGVGWHKAASLVAWGRRQCRAAGNSTLAAPTSWCPSTLTCK